MTDFSIDMTQLSLGGIAPSLMDDCPLATLLMDEQRVQQRVALDPEKAHEYAALYREGRDLGRIVVFSDGSSTILADGFHRAHAAREAGLDTLPAEVHEGSVRDAILYATSCNLHGKPLTNADKRKRVRTLLEDAEWAQWSDNSIAKHCGVAHSFVSKLRDALSLDSETSDGDEPPSTVRTYRDKHGTITTMQTAAIGQRNAPEPSLPLVENGYRLTPDETPALHIAAVEDLVPAPSAPVETPMASPLNGDVVPASMIHNLLRDALCILRELEDTYRAVPELFTLHPEAYHAVTEACKRFITLREPEETTAPSPDSPAVFTVTVPQQIRQVLRDAGKPLTNAAIAKVLNKKLTDTFPVLRRLVAKGEVRKEGETYIYIHPAAPLAAAVEVSA